MWNFFGVLYIVWQIEKGWICAIIWEMEKELALRYLHLLTLPSVGTEMTRSVSILMIIIIKSNNYHTYCFKKELTKYNNYKIVKSNFFQHFKILNYIMRKVNIMFEYEYICMWWYVDRNDKICPNNYLNFNDYYDYYDVIIIMIIVLKKNLKV